MHELPRLLQDWIKHTGSAVGFENTEFLQHWASSIQDHFISASTFHARAFFIHGMLHRHQGDHKPVQALDSHLGILLIFPNTVSVLHRLEILGNLHT